MIGGVRTFLTAVVVVIVLLLAPPAPRGQTVEDPCAPEAQRSSQLMACAERKFREAAAELKRVRDELYADLSPRSRTKLRAAERVWLGYRKTNCDAEASIYENGTIQPLIQLRCMTRLTQERAAEIRSQTQTLYGTN